VHADIRQLVDRLNGIPGLMVSDLSLMMGEPGGESSARLSVAARDRESLQMAVRSLEEFSRRKNLLLIPSAEES
jgi:ACT domain-containing protein